MRIRLTVLSVIAFLIAVLAYSSYATQEGGIDPIRAALARIKADAVDTRSRTRSQPIQTRQDRIWAAADQIERDLARLDAARRRPPPVVVDPPRDPPPTGSAWPAVTEQVWKANAYMTLWGGWNVPQYASGKEWGATGEGPGHLNGPILVDSYGQGMHVGKTLEDCRIVGLGPTPTNKFGERIYNQINPVRRKCEYVGALPEHYIYPSILQGGLYEDCRFGVLGQKNAGGSAIHWALRNHFDKGAGIDYSHETQQAELSQVESTRIYRRCEFNHIGDPATQRWGASTLEEVWAQLTIDGKDTAYVNTHIRFEACRWIGGHLNWTDPNGVLVQSARGFVVQGRPSFTMVDCHMDNPKPYSGWAGRINGVGKVEITNTYIRDGVVEITDATSIRVADCTGGAKLRVNVGGATIHESPISAGYTWSAP